MILEPQEQFKQFLENSKEILILIPENPSADAVGSAWALYYFLEKKGLVPTIAFSNHLSAKFGFMIKPERTLTEISGARDFVLSFDTSRNRIIKIRHEEKDNQFNIFLTPQKGTINPRDFSFILAKYKYDLIIVIDCPDLEKLGKIYAANTDLFFEVPVVNIDHRSNNDNFGQINLIDVTASSCAEIIGMHLEKTDPKLIDKNIATSLLAGLIGATDSFQKKNTTPRALLLAASLMDRGAEQQEIIRWLYKTQPLHVLKLWGRAMAKLNWENDLKLIWSELSVEDFVQSRSSVSDVPQILEKLEENYSDGHFFMAVYNDTPNSTICTLKSVDEEDLKKLTRAMPGEIKRGILEVKMEKGNLEEVGRKVVEKIKLVISTQ